MVIITGINRIYEHDGRRFHLQCEDLGSDIAAYEVRVYDGGSVLWHKRVSYSDLVEEQLGQEAHERTLRLRMEKTIQTVQVAIAKGKIT